MKASHHRPTQATIDLEAISYNFQQVMDHLPPKTQGYAVVKANAYGHGAIEVAKRLSHQVDGFCVSNLDEALELRQAGLEQEILVLGVVPWTALELAQKLNLTITVASQEWIDCALRDSELAGLKVHIKVDSGMGRLGFRDLASIDHAAACLREADALVEGIFTHFATADQADQKLFDEQLAFFKGIIAEMEDCPALVHASNSATSIWHADTVFNMVRLGDVLYGLNPSGRELSMPYEIKPALSLVSELVHVKEVPAGTAIGYGATYHSHEREFVGTVPIGYADGFIRRMQGFSVLVDGQFCPVIGRVSMDQITIRLPQELPLGTRVTLIGQNDGEQITVQEWADHLETINYEVVCLLSDRIPRIY
ncbi:alanine racemase [Streptococcus sp. X16XC17]|uniref:alanine racemase n=1 Tax=unclassified Streptococcus TaxID=2608887 RepID=UPI00066FCE07|nr:MULTISPECIES: alanine racemase [unclassified Streptococcus]TCD45689.1 alanine racemase [Streptococcus sp. X16XC17]